jgi:hypothetical protein
MYSSQSSGIPCLFMVNTGYLGPVSLDRLFPVSRRPADVRISVPLPAFRAP